MRGREGEPTEASSPAAAAARLGCGDDELTPKISSLVDARTSLWRSKTESSASSCTVASSALAFLCGEASIPPSAMPFERRARAIEVPDEEDEEEEDDDDDAEEDEDTKAFTPLPARGLRCRGRRCFALGALTGAMGTAA